MPHHATLDGSNLRSTHDTPDLPTVTNELTIEFQDYLSRGKLTECEDMLNAAIMSKDPGATRLVYTFEQILRKGRNDLEATETAIAFSLLRRIREHIEVQTRELLPKMPDNKVPRPSAFTGRIVKTPVVGMPKIADEPKFQTVNPTTLINNLEFAADPDKPEIVRELKEILSIHLDEVSNTELLEETQELRRLLQDNIKSIPEYVNKSTTTGISKIENNAGYPPNVSELIANARWVLNMEHPESEQFAAAFTYIQQAIDAINGARAEVKNLTQKIRDALRNPKQKQAANQKLLEVSTIDFNSLHQTLDKIIQRADLDSSLEYDKVAERAIGVKVELDFDFTAKLDDLKSDIGIFIDNHYLDDDFEEKFAEQLKKVSEHISAMINRINQLKQEAANTPLVSTPTFDQKSTTEKQSTVPEQHTRGFHQKIAKVLPALYSLAFSTAALTAAVIAINADDYSDSEQLASLMAPDIDLERFQTSTSTTSMAVSATPEDSSQQEVVLEVSVPTAPSAPTVSTSRPGARTAVSVTHTYSTTPEHQPRTLSPLSADEIDMSTIVSQPVASPNSAVDDLSRTAFTSNSYTAIKPSISRTSPTRFQVVTADEGDEGRLRVRSIDDSHSIINRLNPGDEVYGIPWTENGQPVTAKFANFGTFELMLLVDRHGNPTGGFAASPFLHEIVSTTSNTTIPTLDQLPSIDNSAETASQTSDQSLDDFMQDLFGEELASQPTSETNPDLANTITQFHAQIQMPNSNSVIPDWYYAEELPQPDLMQVDDDEEGEFIVIEDADILDEEFELAESDLEPVFTVDVIEDAVEVLDSTKLEMEEVHEQPQPEPVQQAKGFFGKAKSFVKGLFS